MRKGKRIVVMLTCIQIIFASVVTAFAEEYEYDELNRVTKVTYDDGTYVEYFYDANGNLIQTDVYGVESETSRKEQETTIQDSDETIIQEETTIFKDSIIDNETTIITENQTSNSDCDEDETTKIINETEENELESKDNSKTEEGIMEKFSNAIIEMGNCIAKAFKTIINKIKDIFAEIFIK